MDLFAPDAIVYEPFSKLTGGLRVKQAIESFLRLQSWPMIRCNIKLLSKSNMISIDLVDDKGIRNDTNNNTSYDAKVISALVMFEKGDSLKAKFRFELNSDNNATNSKQNKIKALHIQFIT
jgi:hypothetical protein